MNKEGSKQLDKVIEKNPEVGKVLESVFGKSEDSKKAINNVLNAIFK